MIEGTHTSSDCDNCRYCKIFKADKGSCILINKCCMKQGDCEYEPLLPFEEREDEQESEGKE